MSTKRLALIGEFTLEPLKPLLEKALRSYALEDEVVVFGFGRESCIWSGTDPEFASSPPQGAVVIPDAQTLFKRWLDNPRSQGEPGWDGYQAADFLIRTVEAVARRHPDISWVLVTAEIPYPNSADGVADPELDCVYKAIKSFNERLAAACRERGGWSIFDRSRLTAIYGARSMHDSRLAVLARFPGSAFGMQVFAERLAAHWAATRGKMKKVIALDCDNTLWGGIVGEDGVHGIRLGPDGIGAAYLGFQRALLALEARGVILALCSRNNPEDVEQVFSSRPEMAIPRERIAAAHIAWCPKSEGLRALSETLGLGLDSFVFVDDNPVEREEVRQALPEVAVPEFPEDPADLPAFGYELGWRFFYRVSVSDEDKQRTDQYRLRAEIRANIGSGQPGEGFLASLGMKARLALNRLELVNRNTQLTQRTNQFNLTLRRYTEAEIRQMTESSDVLICSGHLADRFGDHGWVGLCIVRRDVKTRCWRLEGLMISCRVLGRGFEQTFAASCLAKARTLWDAPILAEYIPGPKNGQVSRFLDTLGFRLLNEDASGRRLYELPTGVPVNGFAYPIEITWE